MYVFMYVYVCLYVCMYACTYRGQRSSAYPLVGFLFFFFYSFFVFSISTINPRCHEFVLQGSFSLNQTTSKISSKLSWRDAPTMVYSSVNWLKSEPFTTTRLIIELYKLYSKQINREISFKSYTRQDLTRPAQKPRPKLFKRWIVLSTG